MPPSEGETGFDLATRVWCELWKARHGTEFAVGWTGGIGGDDRILQRLGAMALEHGSAAEALLRHKVAAYLADTGNAEWLVNQRHPLRFLERDWNKYGEPKVTKPKPAVANTPAANAVPSTADIAERKRKYEEREKERAATRERNLKIQADLDHDLAAIHRSEP